MQKKAPCRSIRAMTKFNSKVKQTKQKSKPFFSTHNIHLFKCPICKNKKLDKINFFQNIENGGRYAGLCLCCYQFEFNTTKKTTTQAYNIIKKRQKEDDIKRLKKADREIASTVLAATMRRA